MKNDVLILLAAALVFSLFAPEYAYCKPPVSAAAKQFAKIEDALRAVTEQNFNAMNTEDIQALEATCSMSMPGRQAFLEDAAKLFEETDVYLRLEQFKLLNVQGDKAYMAVVQTTLVPEGVRGSNIATSYRNSTCLLPEKETIGYVQVGRFENGRWKIVTISGMPVETTTEGKPVGPVPGTGFSQVRQSCPDGNCQFPRVR